jgi:hypothetical protein
MQQLFSSPDAVDRRPVGVRPDDARQPSSAVRTSGQGRTDQHGMIIGWR